MPPTQILPDGSTARAFPMSLPFPPNVVVKMMFPAASNFVTKTSSDGLPNDAWGITRPPVTYVFPAESAVIAVTLAAADDESGKILRPADNSSHKGDQIDIVATAPSGKLQLDGAFITNEQPFPNVLHATLKATPGLHSLVLVWEGGKKEVDIREFHPTDTSVAAVEIHDVAPGSAVEVDLDRTAFPAAFSIMPQADCTALNTASMVAGTVTSQCPTTMPPTSCASGSTRFFSESPW